MTQTDLAKRTNLTRAAVSAWVMGRAEPREEMKRRIAAVFGTDVETIYRRTDVEAPRGWFHRPAHMDGGREYGNPAMFAFDADLGVLTREATQNSLDERWDAKAPVRVRYTLNEISGEHLTRFLGAVRWGDLEAHYASASQADQKVSRSLRAAIEDLTANRRLRLLRVDDYNAAGLTGPEYGDGRYSAVVRRLLDSHKVDSRRAGGSYGLGKATLWASSRLGLVLINSTLSEPFEGRTVGRLVGRLELPWRMVDGQSYAGPAWFGEFDTNLDHAGVARSWWADDETIRDLHLDRVGAEPGTSFLIVGAHDASGDADDLQEMHDKLVRSLADGFWGAMVGGRSAEPLLEASVTTLRNGQVVIGEERVDPSTTHPAQSRALRAYLDDEVVDELTSGDEVVRVDVPLFVPPRRRAGPNGAVAEHRAVLLVTPADDVENANRIACMRGTRMTVVERRPRDLPMGSMSFQGVLLAGLAAARDSEDASIAEEFLRASEPPEHNKWDRTEDLSTAYARGALARLREFLADIDRAVRGIVGRRETKDDGGPAVLRELLRLDAIGGQSVRPNPAAPIVRNVLAEVDETGAWRVQVDLKLPTAEDPWVLTPVAKFDVRSGGRPTVGWRLLAAAQHCRVEEGNLVIEPGVRSASFIGVTDPSTHPVRGSLARLIVDVHKVRGGAE